MSCGEDPVHSHRRTIESNLKYSSRTCVSVQEIMLPFLKYATQTCVSHMAKEYGVHQYRSGVDGENYVRHDAHLTRCEEGTQEDGGRCVFYSYQLCCMGE